LSNVKHVLASDLNFGFIFRFIFDSLGIYLKSESLNKVLDVVGPTIINDRIEGIKCILKLLS